LEHTNRYVYICCVEVKETYSPEVTRSELLNAAFMEIYIHGYQSASLSRILAKVNYTKGALYHHFPNKKILGLSVIDEIIGVRMQTFFMEPLETTNNPIPVLGEIFQQKAARLSPEEIKYGCPLNNLTQEMAPIDKDFNERLKRITDRWVHTIEDALRRGIKNGFVKQEVNCYGTALLIVASIEGAFGLGKTTDSKDFFMKCMQQLKNYTDGLSR
jgi:TetR/AcrR family transcriptional regulator, transcriptional repressor for nem operon